MSRRYLTRAALVWADAPGDVTLDADFLARAAEPMAVDSPRVRFSGLVDQHGVELMSVADTVPMGFHHGRKGA